MREDVIAAVPGAQPKLTSSKDGDRYYVGQSVSLESIPTFAIDMLPALVREALNPLPPKPHVKTLVEDALERVRGLK